MKKRKKPKADETCDEMNIEIVVKSLLDDPANAIQLIAVMLAAIADSLDDVNDNLFALRRR